MHAKGHVNTIRDLFSIFRDFVYHQRMNKAKPTPPIPGAPSGATWKTLVQEITEAGTSQRKIAEGAGASTSSVSALLKGKTTEPGYRLGFYVVDLHGKLRSAGLIP